jgi:hypothetical protein
MDLLEKAAAGLSGLTLDEIVAEYAEEPTDEESTESEEA